MFFFLVAPSFSGPLVGGSPKIQTRLYRAWLVIDTTPTAKITTMPPMIVLYRPLFPLAAKQTIGPKR